MANVSLQLYCFYNVNEESFSIPLGWQAVIFDTFMVFPDKDKVSGDNGYINDCGIILNEPYQIEVVTRLAEFSLATLI